MRAPLALLALLVLAVSAAAETPRHTPGFPNVETSEHLAELLRLLQDPVVAELLLRLASVGPGSEEAVEELVEKGVLGPEQGAGILRALNSSIDDLAGRADPALLEELRGLLGSEKPDPERLRGLLSTLLAMRESGLLDPYTFIALAGILSGALRKLGFEVPAELSHGVLSSLSGLLSPSTSPSRGAEERPVAGVGAGFPRSPELGASLPSVPTLLETLYPALLSILACSLLTLSLVYRRKRISGLLLRLRASLGRGLEPRTLTAGDDPVSVYWRSVGLVERALGVRKLDHATHREYLSSATRASAELGKYRRTVECFSEITRLYEVVRFAGESLEGAAVRAGEKFREMVESLGRP